MNKSLIKKYLDATFLMEEANPQSLIATEKIIKDSGKENKKAMKDVEKKMKDYTKAEGEEENKDVVKKYNYNKEQKELHDIGELQKGSIINTKIKGETKEYKERQKMAIEGDSTMGNAKEGNVANVVPSDQAGFEGPDGDKETYKNSEKFKKKRDDAEAVYTSPQIGIDGADFSDAQIEKLAKQDKEEEEKVNEGMKRLVFKKEFNGVENALKLIPESYRVDNKTFQMTDGNENYEIRWEGDINEGRAIVIKASDKELMNEDMNKMKHLMGYKSQETLGNLKGAERINENNSFNDIWGKTKTLINEMAGENLELKSLAKKIYLGFKKMGAKVSLTDANTAKDIGAERGDSDNADVFVYVNNDKTFGDTVGVTLVGDRAIGEKDKIKNSFKEFEFTEKEGGKTWQGKRMVDLTIRPGKSVSEGEMWDRDAAHRDTTDDTYYQDNWDEMQDHGEEYTVFVEKNGKTIEYAKYNNEESAEHDVQKLNAIGVKAYY
jgi:hypothetical protein